MLHKGTQRWALDQIDLIPEKRWNGKERVENEGSFRADLAERLSGGKWRTSLDSINCTELKFVFLLLPNLLLQPLEFLIRSLPSFKPLIVNCLLMYFWPRAGWEFRREHSTLKTANQHRRAAGHSEIQRSWRWPSRSFMFLNYMTLVLNLPVAPSAGKKTTR